MAEHCGIRIDEINLLFTIIVWNKCCVLGLQLQQNLIEWKYGGVSTTQHNWKTKKKEEKNEPDFEECIDPIEDLTQHTNYN